MIVYIANVFNARNGLLIKDYILNAGAREEAWDEAIRLVFGETLLCNGKLVMIEEMINPF